MPNIGAFIAWGFVTALFIPSGWWPNAQMARLVDPMLTYLLPLLIAYTAGRNVAGERGGVIGAIAAMGVIVGSDIPMFIGAMVMGPLGGYTILWFDKLTQGRIKAGFEMLVSNFSIGILGMLLAILGYWVIGGAVTGLTLLVSNGVEVVIRRGLLPLVSLLVEPSKVLFLNNALNHGIFSPIGIEQARETGQSIMFLLETNPGPGLGVLLACWFFGRGNMRQSAPGAVIIQFFGGIHEIYFPYILARPALILAPVAGSAAGLLFFSLAGAGLVAPASPGSIISVLAMAPKGQTLVVLAGVLISTAVSLLLGYPTAYYMARTTSRLKQAMVIVILFPFLVSAVVRSYGWMVILGTNGLLNQLLLGLGLISEPLKLLNTEAAVIIGMIHLLIPYMILSLVGVLQSIDPNVEYAAYSLGASPMTTFRKVVFPLSTPGIISGCVLVFTMSMTSYVTPKLLGGSKFRMMATMVVQEINVNFDWGAASAISYILLAVILAVQVVVVLVTGRYMKRMGGGKNA